VAITILEGSTFCICDERGDIDGETQGLFADDTRFLSLLRLTVDGEKPLLLSFGKVEYFSAAFYLRNPLTGGLPQDSVSIIRHRFVGEGMQDRIVVQNQSMEPLSFELALELATDFADILSVKEHDFALGDPARARALPPPVRGRYHEEHNQFVLEERTAKVAPAPRSCPERGDVCKVAHRLDWGRARAGAPGDTSPRSNAT
jgi:glycogen debranching enzyme